MTRPALAYVRLGPRPLANETVAGVLADALPELEIVTVDLKEELRRRPRTLARMAAAATARYGPGLVGHRDPKVAVFRTRTAADALRRIALERLAERPWVATFQIQSLFDASSPGVPHAVFTDHTHLANLSYPDFRHRSLYSSRWIRTEQATFEHAAAVLTRSTNVARSVTGQYGIDPSKVHCVRFGTNVAVVGPGGSGGTCSSRDPSSILFVGVDWERKGGPILAAAFEQVRAVLPDATLTVVGCTPDLPDGARALGRLPASEVAEAYGRAGVFCLPTLVEPFGVVFAEALAAGLPIVGTDVGAVPDMVEHAANGLLVPPGDVDALAAALLDVLADPDRQTAFGAASLRRSEQHYNWREVARRIREVVVSIAGDRFEAATGELVEVGVSR